MRKGGFLQTMKKIAPQTLQGTLQKQWEQLTQCQKSFASTRRGYLEREQLWPDQVRQWLENISGLRKPLAHISAKLAKSEQLPLGLAAHRYPVLQTVHQYDGQLNAMHRLLFAYRFQPAGADVLREIQQQLDTQTRTWATLRRRYGVWMTLLRQADASPS
jgi:hypothetical protein